jgi:hypothetical protein
LNKFNAQRTLENKTKPSLGGRNFDSKLRAALYLHKFEQTESICLKLSLINKLAGHLDRNKFAAVEGTLFESLSTINNGHEWHLDSESTACLTYGQKSVVHLLSTIIVRVKLNDASGYRVTIPKDFPNLSLLKERIACELSEKSITIEVSDQESSFKFLSVTEIKHQIQGALINIYEKKIRAEQFVISNEQ